MTSPPIQWYPGHIAKAERQLFNNLKRVDVALEVRDARIPLATHHPHLDRWLGDKAKVLVINRVDMIPPELRVQWEAWFRERGETPYFTDAQRGIGVKTLAQAAQAAGRAMNQRRVSRGMKPRAVRAVVLGFPNVGKSALINRLVNRRVVASARRAGVTRQLRWVRLGQDLDLLDAPGVLPAKLNNQAAALNLAFCDDIGEAAYDNQRVAAALLDQVQRLQRETPFIPPDVLQRRYGIADQTHTGEDYLAQWAEASYQDDRERAACQLLNDFRKGLLGAIPLELPD
ncbi:ribosome biogenesis GTPase YlqF [Prochlorothrix hollandica]|uniref:Ribosome biogenesis GTPase A n=1 Tax=Prochlorothrix hollandica PCC 9006 = CALU 1027 TaxID=317619 RepID=A0A0M2Q438_PROHO|nr:ribosome biogenesis GTPase YlqF [Prochlorothrix hollandica]KKJ01332.1 GTPase [Prochlorothrix hollandica PCC 9006 = CALU 1027]